MRRAYGNLVVAAIAFIVLGAQCKPNTVEPTTMNSTKLSFQTQDGVTIVGDYTVPQSTPRGFILLLHMMPTDRSSWYAFMQVLVKHGFASLAIDLRGHGQSIRQQGNPKPLDYKTFSDGEHQNSIYDVQAAVRWLKETHQAPPDRIALAGASIGANLALQYMTEHPEIKAGILLSPGLDYWGIKTEPLAKVLRLEQAVFLAAGTDDGYSFDTNRILFNLLRSKKELRELTDAGHGTTMFVSVPHLIDEILEWLSSLY